MAAETARAATYRVIKREITAVSTGNSCAAYRQKSNVSSLFVCSLQKVTWKSLKKRFNKHVTALPD